MADSIFMPILAKKLLTFIMPTLLAGFIVYDNFLPLFKTPKRVERSISSVSTDSAALAAASRSAKNIPNGKYYAFKPDYYCDNTQLKRRVASFFDSYEVNNGVICHNGDSCQQKAAQCSSEIPKGMAYNKKEYTLVADRFTFKKLEQPTPADCNIPTCGALPDICQFDQMAPLDGHGCPQGCGTISCHAARQDCPVVKCAAPPQGCEYDGKSTTDSNGCALGCGQLVCDTIDDRPHVNHCELKCAPAPENCSYQGATYGDNGCQTSCGQLVCLRPDPKAPACPSLPQCAQPPSGCYYAGEPERDENSCIVGCRSLVCPKKVNNKCKPPVCAPAPPNCRYDGNSPLDFEGCSTGCGKLNCSN